MDNEQQDNNSLPEGWELSKVGHIVKVQGGFAFKAKQFLKTGIPVVRIGDLQAGSVHISDKTAYLPSEYLDEFPNVCLKKGDTLMALSGATTGKTATFNLDCPALLNQRVGRFLPYSRNDIHNGFLQHLIKKLSEGILEQAWGGAQPNVSPTTIENNNIAIPPLPEQKRIAERIDSLQSKSRQAREALELARPKLDQLRQSILAAAFRGDLTAQWRKDNPDTESATTLLERIRTERRQKWEQAELAKMQAKGKPPKNDKWNSKYKEPAPVDTTDLPELPEGWCWASVEELCSGNIQTGPFGGLLHKSDYTSKGVPVLNIGNVKWGYIDLNQVNYVSSTKAAELTKFKLKTGDILFTRSGTVGRSAVLPSTANEHLMSGHILRIRQDNKWYSQELLAKAFRGEPTIQNQLNKLTRGATRPGFNTKLLSSILLPVPPRIEQDQIQALLKIHENQISQIEAVENQVIERLSTLDQSILAKAFRGELVPQDPNDEPASVLLERIKAERAALKPKKIKRKPKQKKKP